MLSPLAAAIAFVVEYALVAALLAGLAWHRLGAAGARERLGLAGVATAFTPFVLGVLQGGFFLVAPARSRALYLGAHAIALLVAGGLGRRALSRAFVEAGGAIRSAVRAERARALPLIPLLLLSAFLVNQSARIALSPLDAHDATVYALDARRVSGAGRFDALMTHVPDAKNQVTNHNHGSSYAFYLASALGWSADARQDLPARVAQKLCALQLFLVALALGISVSWSAGLVAPFLLLGSRSLPYVFTASSRDPYLMLALATVLGSLTVFARHRSAATWLALTFSFAFLCNSHSSSFTLAPFLAGTAILLGPSMRERMLVAGAAVAALPLGAGNAISTLYRTGSLTGDSFSYYRQYAGTALLDAVLKKRGTPAPGLGTALAKLSNQISGDGALIVGALFAGGLVVLGLELYPRLRGRRPGEVPRVVMLAAGVGLLVEAQILGFFDLVDPRISGLMFTNLRYRLPAQLFGAVAGAFVVGIAAEWIADGRRSWTRRLLAPSLLLAPVIAGAWTARARWPRGHAGPFADTRAADHYLATRVERFSFLARFASLPASERILMAPAYDAWYHADNDVISLFDPRLRPAFTAPDVEGALAALDRLQVRAFCLRPYDLDVLAQGPLGTALSAPYFEIVEANAHWRIARRTGKE